MNISALPQEYKDIYDEFIMPVDTNIKLESVILSQENIDKINEFIKETQYRDKLMEYGLVPMNRLLMYGESGTGKTFLSKALSNHLGYTMLYVDIAKALSEVTVAINIANIFKLANHMGNCLLMFDECDSIAWQRDTGGADTGTIRRATNSIFQYLDQMNKTNIFISATNMLHRLDPAFERRFNMKMEFKRPEMNLKDAVRHFIYPKFEIVDDVDNITMDIINRRAKQYTKLSYYEIEGIVERAMKRAVMNDSNKVRTADIYNDLAVAMKVKIKFQNEDNEI